MAHIVDQSNRGPTGAEVDDAEGTHRAGPQLAVAANLRTGEVTEQDPQHRLVRDDQDGAAVVPLFELAEGRQSPCRYRRRGLATGRAHRRIAEPARVVLRVGRGGLVLRQAL